MEYNELKELVESIEYNGVLAEIGKHISIKTLPPSSFSLAGTVEIKAIWFDGEEYQRTRLALTIHNGWPKEMVTLGIIRSIQEVILATFRKGVMIDGQSIFEIENKDLNHE